MTRWTAVALCALIMLRDAWAANPASDNAADPAYSGGWTNGSNGGSGFGPWQLSTVGAVAGHFIGDSTLNADQLDDGAINGVANDSDINTGAFRPAAWGMYAEANSVARALRPFTGGPLATGQTFSVNLDNGYIELDGSISLGLYDASSNAIFGVLFIGGSVNYQYFDVSFPAALALTYGDEGLNLSITMVGITNYQATLTRFDGSNVTWSGSVSAQPQGFFAQVSSVGGGPPRDFFVNSMSIVPEPATLALGALGALSFALRMLRRRAL